MTLYTQEISLRRCPIGANRWHALVGIWLFCSAVTFGIHVPDNADGLIDIKMEDMDSRYHSIEAPNSLGYRHQEMERLVTKAGYPLETHYVETKDGYVLGVYRIPHGYQGTDFDPGKCTHARQKVLLQHGLLDSSATWVLNSRRNSLGFLLADSGYDVWLANSRGNAFSRNHTGFLPTSKIFWDFTFDDMAAFDLPAILDYMLDVGSCGKHTVSEKIHLISHSQGTTISFASMIMLQDVREKINLFVALAPAVYLKYVTSIPLRFLAQMKADQIIALLGENEFLPNRKDMSEIFGEFCSVTPKACVSIITAICGFSEQNVDVSRLPIYLAYAPSGTSVKNIRHWGQLVRKEEEITDDWFGMFDYGDLCQDQSGKRLDCNQREYGSLRPPIYNLSLMHGPRIAVFYGYQDRLADPIDVDRLIQTLPKESVIFRKGILGYEHIDFTWAHNSYEYVYKDILELLGSS